MLALIMAFVCGCSAPEAKPAAKNTPEAEVTPEPVEEEDGENGCITTAKRIGGGLTIKTVILDGVITSVEVLDHNETHGISDPAIEQIPQRIADENSVNVDIVSGATVTSDAIISAVKAAIEKTGLSVDEFMKGTAIEREQPSH